MKKGMALSIVCLTLLYMTSLSVAVAVPLANNRQIDIAVSNDNGAQNGSGPNDTYYIDAPGGGLNQLHISTDGTIAGLFGQVTTKNIDTSSTSGSFYVTTTGGRGFNDSLILMFSMTGPISDDFNLKIKSSGYQWTATGSAPVNPTYVSGAINEVFTAGDFMYGPQTTKPGPGTLGVGSLPFYSGQNINDPATAQNLMFIDLYLGNTSDRSSIDSGNAKVEFELDGIYGSTAAFNVYSWAAVAAIGNGTINWTNRLSTNPLEAGQSGYSINTSAVEAIPEPSQFALLGAGFFALALTRRKRSA